MDWELGTRLFIFTVLIAGIIWDVITIKRGGVHTSISRKIRSANAKYPFIAPLVFFVLGHLFWPQPPHESKITKCEAQVARLKMECSK